MYESSNFYRFLFWIFSRICRMFCSFRIYTTLRKTLHMHVDFCGPVTKLENWQRNYPLSNNFSRGLFFTTFHFFRILSGKYVFRRPASDRVSCIHWPQAISRLIWKSAREYSCEFWNPKQNQHTKSMNFLSIWKITCTYDETILASLRNWTSQHKNCDRIWFACFAHSTYGFRGRAFRRFHKYCIFVKSILPSHPILSGWCWKLAQVNRDYHRYRCCNKIE